MVGVDDPIRGEIIKVFIQPTEDAIVGDPLKGDIQRLIKDRLTMYEYPREIAFVDELPTTTTGKIQRRKLRDGEYDD